MLRKKITLYSFFIVLFSLFSVAAPGFDAYSANVNACACSVAEQNLIINNTGDVPLFFTVYPKGEVGSWTVAAPKTVDVYPASFKPVAEFIKVPCDASGIYNLQTDIKSDRGIDKTVSQRITVSRCDNIALQPLAFPDAGCLCSTFEFRFNVKNPASFADTYTFYAGRYEPYAVFTPASIYLPPGKNQTISLFITPACSIATSNDFSIIVSSFNNGVSETIPARLNINNTCAAYERTPVNVTARPVSVRNFERFLITSLILVIALFVLLFFVVLVKKATDRKKPYELTDKHPKKIIVKEEKYGWEKIFKKAKKEKNSFPWKKVLLGLLAIIAGVLLLVLINSAMPKKAPVNESELIIPETVLNATISESQPVSFKTPDGSFVIVAIVVAAILALILYFSKAGFKVSRGVVIVLILVACLIFAFILFQNKAIIGKEANNTLLEFVGPNVSESDVQENQNSGQINMTQVKNSMASFFPRELFNTYFPYVVAGMLILAITIFALLHFDRKSK